MEKVAVTTPLSLKPPLVGTAEAKLYDAEGKTVPLKNLLVETAVALMYDADAIAVPLKNTLDGADALMNTLDGVADSVTNTLDGAADSVTNTLDGAEDAVTYTLDGAAEPEMNTLDGRTVVKAVPVAVALAVSVPTIVTVMREQLTALDVPTGKPTEDTIVPVG